MSAWNLENTVFSSYCFYAGVLAAKVLLMGPATGYYRITKKVFANEEDAKSMGAKGVQMNDPDVERVRRAHQNDLENIPVFWILGLLYVLTNPSEMIAKNVFRAFCGARVMHTVFYLGGSSRRGIAYMLGMACNVFLAVNVIMNFCC